MAATRMPQKNPRVYCILTYILPAPMKHVRAMVTFPCLVTLGCGVLVAIASRSESTEVLTREGKLLSVPRRNAMKVLLISFAVGLAVGILYGLIRVKSPAPPIVALLGLLGMVLGEQLGIWIQTKKVDVPRAAAVCLVGESHHSVASVQSAFSVPGTGSRAN